MRKYTFIFILALLFASCGDEDASPLFICGVFDPVLELTWLQERTAEINQSDNSTYTYFTAGTIQGQQVFIEKNCCPNCNSAFLVYACDGQILEFLGIGGIDPNTVEDESVIWRGFNFTCGV